MLDNNNSTDDNQKIVDNMISEPTVVCWNAEKQDNKRIYFLVAAVVLITVIVAILLFSGNKEISEVYIDPPTQVDLAKIEQIFYKGEDGVAAIDLLAKYSVTAVVKSKKKYNSDSASSVSPMDLALAWGNLNEKEIDQEVTYSQRGRWYYYHIDDLSVVTLNDVSTQSSNHHLIPSNEKVLDKIKAIRVNDTVILEGYLVSVILFPDASPWTSSLTRLDTGDKSCEIMYVTDVTIK